MKTLTLSAFALLFVSLAPSAFSQFQTSLDEGLYVFVQTTVRDSDGVLLTYFESSKFTDLDVERLGPFLDFEATRGDDPIVTIGGDSYQVIRRVQSQTFDSFNVLASTSLHYAVDGESVQLARFVHDGYPVSAGDAMESIWTFARIV